jgi:two-component system, OmpR family, response regulator
MDLGGSSMVVGPPQGRSATTWAAAPVRVCRACADGSHRPTAVPTAGKGATVTASPILVLTVEDDPSFRSLLSTVLSARGRYEVRAADLDHWLEDVCASPPDVLLLDLTLRDEDAVPHIPKVVVACPRTMVAALTARPAVEEESSVLSAGAFVFYEKSQIRELPDQLEEDLALFRRSLAGESVAAPSALVRRPSRREVDSEPHKLE